MSGHVGRWYWRWIIGISLLLSTPATSWAQMAGAISGKVQDPSGAAVAAVKVIVTSLETGAERVVNTAAGGDYKVLALAVGKYSIRAEKTGFKAAVVSGINLVAGQEAVVNLHLEVGEVVQQVTVSGQLPLVNTTTAPVSGLVGEEEVKDLPLNGRSFDNLMALDPGVINYSAMKTAQTSTSNGNTFSVDGRRTGENLFLLNGIEYTGSSQLAVTPGGVGGSLLGIDAVREFNVLTDTYSAEYGKRAGAQVSIVTQSGSNTLHGSLFEFLRNSDLDARNFYDVDNIPAFRRNQFGAALGGPLRKDRIFVFGNYEGFRQRLGLSSVSEVPDAAARNGELPNSSGVETPVPKLNAAMLPYMALWPVANGPELLEKGLPSGVALSYANPLQTVREDFGNLRTDYTLGPRDSLSVIYTLDDGANLEPQPDPLFAAFNTLRSQVASVEETHIFSPQIINTFRAGFSRAGFGFASSPFETFPASLSFVSGQGPGGIVIGGGVTTTELSAITSAGPNNAANVWNRRNLFTYTDDLRTIKGKHQISVGVWFQRLQSNDDTASRRLGQAAFGTLQTFLQGTESTFQVVTNPNELGWRSLFGAWYVDDTIKATSRLTLRVGLRHEFTTGWNETFGRAANYVTSGGILQSDPRVASSVFTQNNAHWLLSPRVGLAWDPFGTGKTVVHAGFGTYYTMIDSLAFLLNAIPPYNGTLTYSGMPFPSLVPVVPTGQEPPPCSPGLSGTCAIYGPEGIQPNAKTPTVQEWNFSIEQEIARGTILRLGYSGSFATHELLNIDPNSIPPQICANANGCASGGVSATHGNVASGMQYIPVGTRPNSDLSGGFFWYTEGNASYNALKAEVIRRITHSLQFRANYTWGKNLDFNSGLTGAQADNQAQMVLDRFDLHRDWGLAALNLTSESSISAHYELPMGRGQHWLAGTSGWQGKLADGWQLNGIASLLGGFPFTPQVGSNLSGDGDTRNPDRPSLNPAFSGPVLLKSPHQWFNPSAFVLPTAGTYGDLGRGTFIGPGLTEIDISVLKDTSLSERCRLEFRAEFFNLPNHANFGTPNAIVFSGSSVSPTAGLISSTATTSRQIQFGLKLIF